MQVKEFREMSSDELVQKRRERKEGLFHLRLRRATGQLESPMKLTEARRDLARMETVLREREIRGAGEKAG